MPGQDCLISLVSYAPPPAVQNHLEARRLQIPLQQIAERDSSTSIEVVSARAASIPSDRAYVAGAPYEGANGREGAGRHNEVTEKEATVRPVNVTQNPVGPSTAGVVASRKTSEEGTELVSAPVVKSALRAPSNPLKKKKTVAFGRTVNVSQTVEGSPFRRRAIASSLAARRSKMGNTGDGVKELNEKVKKCEDQIESLRETVEKLEKKDVEKEEHILKLTEMIKELSVFSTPPRAQTTEGKAQAAVPRCAEKKRYGRGKENIPPWETGECADEDNDEYHRTARAPATANFIGRSSGRNYAVGSANGPSNRSNEEKWAMVRRKLEQDENFERYVNEGFMRFGSDATLDEMVKMQRHNQARRDEGANAQQGRYYSTEDGGVPMVHTTRVTKQMTVEQIQHSPARSAAFSVDTVRYLARHGFINEGEDDENDGGGQYGGRRGELLNKQSLYEPGGSVTYYRPREQSRRASSPTRRVVRQCTVTGSGGRAYRNDRAGQNEVAYGRTAPQVVEVAESDSEEILNEAVDFEDIEGAEGSPRRARVPTKQGTPTNDGQRVGRAMRGAQIANTKTGRRF